MISAATRSTGAAATTVAVTQPALSKWLNTATELFHRIAGFIGTKAISSYLA